MCVMMHLRLSVYNEIRSFDVENHSYIVKFRGFSVVRLLTDNALEGLRKRASASSGTSIGVA